MIETELDLGWQRLAGHLAPGAPRASLRPRFPWARWVLVGTVLVVGIAAFRLALSWSDRPLHYIVEGATMEAAGTITAASSARVFFSDESQLGIKPSARIKVRATDAYGAQVAIADGSIDVMVKPRKHSSWRFEAGPFAILVKGAAFRLGFEAAKGHLDLHVKTGVIEVRGRREDGVLTLGGGEGVELFANPPQEAPSAAAIQARQDVSQRAKEAKNSR